MSDKIRVPVGLLRHASEVILEHLESVEGDEVLLERDYYWAIAPEQLYDVYVEPSSFSVGQVSECVELLEQLIEDPSRATSFALVWLSEVLRATGQSVVR